MTTRKIITLVDGLMRGVIDSDFVSPGSGISFKKTIINPTITVEDLGFSQGTLANPIFIVGQHVSGEGSKGGALALFAGEGGEGGDLYLLSGNANVNDRKGGNIFIIAGQPLGSPIPDATGGSVQILSGNSITNGTVTLGVNSVNTDAIKIDASANVSISGSNTTTLSIKVPAQDRLLADFHGLTTIANSLFLQDDFATLVGTIKTDDNTKLVIDADGPSATSIEFQIADVPVSSLSAASSSISTTTLDINGTTLNANVTSAVFKSSFIVINDTSNNAFGSFDTTSPNILQLLANDNLVISPNNDLTLTSGNTSIFFSGRVVKNGNNLTSTASQTISVSTNSFWVMPDPTMVANVTVTIDLTGVSDLIILVIERIDTTAHQLIIKNNGGTTLMTIPNSTPRHVVLQYDGVAGDWVLSSWYNT